MGERPRSKVYMDVSIDGTPAGRLLFELWNDVCPRTAENFRALCTGEKGFSALTRNKLHFEGNKFHRIIPGFMAQAGDFTREDGTGGESIYGVKFADEPAGLRLKHTEPGLLSMANSGPDTNGSQFFITFVATPWLDGRHVVFGKLVEGMPVLRAMERVQTGANDRPKKTVAITACGELLNGMTTSEAAHAYVAAAEARKQEELAASSRLHGMSLKDLMAGSNKRLMARDIANAGVPLSFGRASKARATGAAGEEARGSTNPAAVAEKALAAHIAQQRVTAGVDGTLEGAPITAASRGAMGALLALGTSAASSASEAPSVSAAPAEGAEGAARPAGTAADEALPGVDASVRDKLAALRQRMNAGRKDNRKQVEFEFKRQMDAERKTERVGAAARGEPPLPSDAAKRARATGEESQESAAAQAAKRKRVVEEQIPGQATLPAYMLEPVATAEAKAAEAAAKEERKLGSFGWNAFNSDSKFRAHERRVAALPGSKEGGGSGASAEIIGHSDMLVPYAAPGELLTAAAGGAGAGALTYGSADYVDPAGVERMLKELKDTEDRRAKFSRRRAIDEDAGVDYINESNRRFNKRLEHAYGKFTVEAKQNVERGSAL